MEKVALGGMRACTRSKVDPKRANPTVQLLNKEESPT